MELRFVDAIKNKDCLKNAKKLYSSAFPIAERIPFFMLERACKKGRADFFGIYDAQTFVGIVYMLLVDDAALIFYFAVDEKLRGKDTEALFFPRSRKNIREREFFLKSKNRMSTQRTIRSVCAVKLFMKGTVLSLADSPPVLL